MRLVRTIYLGLTLSMGTIFAHHLAGGEFVDLPQFLVIAVITFGVGTLLSLSEMEGPALAAAFVVTQLLGHFTLSAKYDNSITMYCSHLLLGLLGYFLLGYIEKIARWGFDNLVVSFEKLPEICIEKAAVLFFEDLRSIFVNHAITRYWSPAPPFPSL